VVEGIVGEKTFKSFQDLKRYKAGNFREQLFVDELCRGIAVNTSYSSYIQVSDTSTELFSFKNSTKQVHCLGGGGF